VLFVARPRLLVYFQLVAAIGQINIVSTIPALLFRVSGLLCVASHYNCPDHSDHYNLILITVAISYHRSIQATVSMSTDRTYSVL